MGLQLLAEGDARQQGKTTALLDIALANARRGKYVEFWSRGPREAAEAYRLARDLVPSSDAHYGVRFHGANGDQSIRYGSTRGAVMFTWGGRVARICSPRTEVHIDDTGTGAIEFRNDVLAGRPSHV
ncbi:hypothetical protein I5H08_gp016 [Mycobacterium phage Yuna]|uniref:Uncharacterized protein n=1 Tax=Mycobacterium phage Yuna TaxID=2599885 RepID=A0A5J6TF30_9CAUD|nr:hypothetical protein I5H08_gp016 [Mycobacterium phage Yuna]QFG09471.1 hypothetical protein PBI_YUNA_89 [Mycobacterium phage Yuna]